MIETKITRRETAVSFKPRLIEKGKSKGFKYLCMDSDVSDGDLQAFLGKEVVRDILWTNIKTLCISIFRQSCQDENGAEVAFDLQSFTSAIIQLEERTESKSKLNERKDALALELEALTEQDEITVETVQKMKELGAALRAVRLAIEKRSRTKAEPVEDVDEEESEKDAPEKEDEND